MSAGPLHLPLHPGPRGDGATPLTAPLPCLPRHLVPASRVGLSAFARAGTASPEGAEAATVVFQRAKLGGNLLLCIAKGRAAWVAELGGALSASNLAPPGHFRSLS